jgi:hypothetical protein
MKLKLNENVCKCLALIILSAIVGMVVYRHTNPGKTLENFEGMKINSRDPVVFMVPITDAGGGDKNNFFKFVITGQNAISYSFGGVPTDTEMVKGKGTVSGTVPTPKNDAQIFPTDDNKIKLYWDGNAMYTLTVALSGRPVVKGAPATQKSNDKKNLGPLKCISGNALYSINRTGRGRASDTHEIKKDGNGTGIIIKASTNAVFIHCVKSNSKKKVVGGASGSHLKFIVGFNNNTYIDYNWDMRTAKASLTPLAKSPTGLDTLVSHLGSINDICVVDAKSDSINSELVFLRKNQ